jgi:hypothetical protein
MSKKAIAAIVALLSVVQVSSAAYLTDWTAPDVLSLADPVDTTGGDGSREISQIWYRQVGATHYFRMDLAEAPTIGGGQSSPDYLIYLDTIGGGISSAQSAYIAQGLAGIDEIVDGHFQAGGGWINHNHDVNLGNPPYLLNVATLASAGGAFQNSEGGGAHLEWSVPTSAFQQQVFTFYGGATDIFTPQTWDVTGPIHTPEPGTFMMLAAIGVVGAGFHLLRRRAS